MGKNQKLTQSFLDIEACDRAHEEDSYAPKHLYQYLGLTRETLRYYEKIHLLEPQIVPESQYRRFSFEDILKLFYIDFYKKRSFSSAIIKEMIQKDPASILSVIHEKKLDIEKEIQKLMEVKKCLEQDEALLAQVPDQLLKPRLMEFPLYESLHRITSFSSIKEYDKVLEYADLDKELTSQMIREVSFDEEDGYQDSVVHIVKPGNPAVEKPTYLSHGKSVYVLVECKEDDPNVMERMFYLLKEWMKAHELTPLGTVYIQSAFMMYEAGSFVNYCHSWTLVK